MVLKSEKLITKIYIPDAVIRQGLKKGDSILDIGCAKGFFLSGCDKLGLKTYGVDISEEWLKFAGKNSKAVLKVCDLDNEKIPFGDGMFDEVTAFDVIEHLNSPYLFLLECRRVLKPRGKLIITTPNLNSLGRLVMGDRWHGFQDKTHKYLFTTASLRHVLSKCKFRNIEIHAPFHPLPKFFQGIFNKTGMGGQIWVATIK